MPRDDLVRDPEELAVRALRAFDAGFFTNAPDPFVPASRCVPNSSCFEAFEPTGIHIFPAPEKIAEQLDFSRDRRIFCDWGSRNGNNAYNEPEVLASFKQGMLRG
jgi:hypothetical protein